MGGKAQIPRYDYLASINESGWLEVGVIAVDSGQISIADASMTTRNRNRHGINIGGFGSDGSYPVQVKMGEDGLISEARIVFEESSV